MVLRQTSSGWDIGLSVVAERRRTWWGPSTRLRRDGLTRIPVRLTGRIRVAQIIERGSINLAAFSQKCVARVSRGRVEKSIFDPGISKAARVHTTKTILLLLTALCNQTSKRFLQRQRPCSALTSVSHSAERRAKITRFSIK